jgi:hypothetical protein
MVGLLLALKVGAQRFDLFAYNHPAHTQLLGDKTDAASSYSSALSGKNSEQAAQGKIAKEQLDDLGTQASQAPLPASGSVDVGRIQATAGASNATPVAQKVDVSELASLSSQPTTVQSPDLRSGQTVTSTSGATTGAVGTAQPSSPKLPSKRPGKITNRVVVGNAETTSPTAAPVTPSVSRTLPRVRALAPGRGERADVRRPGKAGMPEGEVKTN